MLKIQKLLITVMTLFALAACAGPALKIAPVSVSDNPSAKIAQLEQALTESRAQQVNVLSPSWYAQAEGYLAKAQTGLKENDSVADVLKNVAFGQALLDKAKDYTRIARSALGEAIKARDLAISAGAASFGVDYQTLEEQFITLTADIENDNLSRAEKNKARVTQGFADLELRAIKEKTLGEVRNLIAAAETKNAALVAPKTLSKAKNTLLEADKFISEQRYEREKMQEKAAQALFQAQRLGQIMVISNKVKTMLPEDVALWNEAQVDKVTTKLASRDLRNETPEIQLQSILESIASLQDDNQHLIAQGHEKTIEYETKVTQLQADIEAQRQQISVLEGQSKEAQKASAIIAMQEKEAKERLAAERRFQEQFKEVQAMFSADQAEVYKQSDNLVIRLKAIQFPVGQNIIMPDNYALLSTVRKAIRTFGEPQVAIEGHTDSTGSVASNAQLSLARANAVREYFVANSTLTEDKISATGYGSERPLASNDSAEGRAINRRIDVVIKTEMIAK